MNIDIKAIRAAAEAAEEHFYNERRQFDFKRLADRKTVIALLDRLEAAEKAIQLVRNAALEEAACRCEKEYDNWDNERPLRICATAIRSLKV